LQRSISRRFNNQSGEGCVGFHELALCDVIQRHPIWHREKEKVTSAKEPFLVAFWLGFGLHLLTPKQVKGLLHLFDTGNPAPKPGCSDPNLGAPNKACTPPGPGIRPGVAPGKPSENCKELGNILIIQGCCNSPIPNDSRKRWHNHFHLCSTSSGHM
jgi:hypothetical protein